MRRSASKAEPAGHGTRRQPSHAEMQARIDFLEAELRAASVREAATAKALGESREYQTATSSVLHVISRSAFDLQPLLDALVETAGRLCDAEMAMIYRRDGEAYSLAANWGFPPDFEAIARQRRLTPGRGTVVGRTVVDRDVVQIIDPTADPEYDFAEASDEGKARTRLGVPLLREGEPIGVIVLARQRVEPFTEHQIEVVRTFADQAVIAMENARLFTVTQEALEQQTATAEVLQVINSSPGNLAPVFDAMLEKATRVCAAHAGVLVTYDGGQFWPVAHRGFPDFPREPIQAHPEIGIGRIERGEDIIHILDSASGEAYTSGNLARRAIVELGGARSQLTAALRKEGVLLGAFTIWRKEVRPFADKEIALLQNFAAQAVIAMENARLITETREALERQTATSEVLEIISSSPGRLEPVFEAVVGKAVRICGGTFGLLGLRDGDGFRGVAVYGVSRELSDNLSRLHTPPPGTGLHRLNETLETVQVADCAAEPAYDAVRAFNPPFAAVRTALHVPMLKERELLGAILIYRDQLRPFEEKEINLVENFAKQAVIAIENARLITETREALEQQTATAEVLQVINSSPGDLAPVFSAILEKAHTSCGTAHGSLQLYDGEILRAVATQGVAPEFAEILHRGYRAADSPASAALIAGERFIQVADSATVDHPVFRSAAELAGIGTVLFVPLLKEDTFLGLISAARREVHSFTEKQIALLQNFAAQAVIAMENARLITETREALEQQTATAEVLRVISSSPTDVQPTFDAIVASAAKLCEGEFSAVVRFEDGLLHLVATNNLSPEEAAAFHSLFPCPPSRSFVMGRAFIDGQPAQFDDVLADSSYDSQAREVLQAALGYRTFMAVPIFRAGTPIGVIGCARRQVRPFTAAQIELLKTFADQAVIAIENTRLFTETSEALEQQTATAEVLQVINASPGDLAPVFDAMLERAMRLCDASMGVFSIFDGNRFKPRVSRGVPPRYAEYLATTSDQPSPDGTNQRVLAGENVAHVTDLMEAMGYRTGHPWVRALVELGDARTLVTVALRKDAALLGTITLYRREVRSFSNKEIALLDNFAAQAVIAMDNARLLDEIRQRQAELRVTFENMGDGVAMFDAELRLAAWNRNFQQLLDLPESLLEERPSYAKYIRLLAERGEFGADDIQAELSRRLEHTDEELRLERTRPDGRVIEVRRNSVAGGGMVLIYGDITERKRSEEEIRAARDAAERALGELRAAQANLIQAEKMASLGQLTAGIAHEIKNPLNFVNNFAGLSVELLDELKEETAPALATLDRNKQAEIDDTIEMLTGNLQKIAEHGKRADNIVKSMLEHSRGVSGERRSVDLNTLIDEALNLAYHGARAQDQSFNITLERDFDPELAPIDLAPQEITRVFLNLFGNGFYAATRLGRNGQAADGFRPVLKVTTRDMGNAVEIRVRDNGIGIAPEIRDKLFQPFFTTKPTGEGTGLGLSISYDIVTQQHGGTIEVDSEVGEFTEFTVRLPRQNDTTASGRAA